MPRIRTIKPEFWVSEQLLECSRNARLLFVALWCFCDDAGRHRYSPRTIKAEAFPGDDDVTAALVDEWLHELAHNRLIAFYENNSERFLYVTGWHHQRIDKPQAPKFPDPAESTLLPVGDCSRNHSQNVPGTVPPEGKGKEGKGKEGILRTSMSRSLREPRPVDVAESVGQVFKHWQAVHDKPRSRLVVGDKRWRAVSARLDAGYTVEDLCLAVDGCKLSPHHQGQNDRGTVYADLELICRDASHVDAFVEMAHDPPKPQAKGAAGVEQRGREHADEWVRQREGVTIDAG